MARERAKHVNLNPAPFREYAGVMTAFIVVMAFCSIGFMVMFGQIFGYDLTVPGDWSAAMLSLASAGLGYLIGKQHAKDEAPATPTPVPAPPGYFACERPDCPASRPPEE